MPLPAGYTEAQAPELFKFENKGDHIEGILSHTKTETINGDAVLELYIFTGRRTVRVRPGWDIKSKLNRGMIGKLIYLEYYGDDESRGKDGNPLKVFIVGSKAIPKQASGESEDPGITDDDIPF